MLKLARAPRPTAFRPVVAVEEMASGERMRDDPYVPIVGRAVITKASE